MPKVVVIDDDVEILKIFPRLLAGSEFEPCCTSDVETFLERVRSERPVAAIVDFWLLDNTALPLLDRLRAEGLDLPVVLMSGGGGGHSALMAETLGEVCGIVSFLHKPFRRAEVIEALRGAAAVALN
ncbi:hypothetical protein DSD19_00050 [Rhodovulum sp. BSW8]|uniref:Response regulator receiver domain-containing protein n=1 Tax=Rhodovulum visakhapatnamense TaxID=364297 RepID=A0A4R8FVG5_9RHOB|nr:MULTISPECIES: response regulator [Rhodovulum]RBO55180.1 hypothetical protein DSD19_00050 [Rhodovulum sp. BSW8]TDX30527.1 response regulator receiver domain-containing protein [Rhodovulum visakhapatnamense]